jgi:hypothetical protein
MSGAKISTVHVTLLFRGPRIVGPNKIGPKFVGTNARPGFKFGQKCPDLAQAKLGQNTKIS